MKAWMVALLCCIAFTVLAQPTAADGPTCLENCQHEYIMCVWNGPPAPQPSCSQQLTACRQACNSSSSAIIEGTGPMGEYSKPSANCSAALLRLHERSLWRQYVPVSR